MASNSHRAAPFYGVAAPFRSRDGLSTRAVSGTDEIQLRIDPFDLEDEITGLHTQVRRLKHVASEIGTEVKYQKDFLEQVQMGIMKAQVGVKNNMRRLNKAVIKSGSNHILHIVTFGLVLFLIVYLWSTISRK
ncbi:bet1-like protein At4g14600 [Arachis duranensis]|uniref:Bet1-like protein At4g14600 n=1 Tax=Arachis duranensis TaxID=130453 RepID=A0A6P4BXT6_ARADU|nr:bet1-like protein At4g14600 [Arachis duranensis]